MGVEFGETDYDQVSLFSSSRLSLTADIGCRYGVNNIRALLGHKVDLNFIESNPAVRLEKD